MGARSLCALVLMVTAGLALLSLPSSLMALQFSESSLRRMFNVIDLDDNDSITLAELITHMRHMDEEHHKNIESSKGINTIKLAMDRIDMDHSGTIEWNEMLSRYSRLLHAKSLMQTGGRDLRDDILFINPQQEHIALTDDPSEMVVMWVTSVDSNGSTVEYGFSPTTLDASTDGIVYTYEAGVWGWDGHIHKVMLKGLARGQKYFYRVGDKTLNVWSEVHYFNTQPVLKGEVKIAVYGDMGTIMPMGFEVADQLIHDDEKYHFDLITHVGDLAYAGVSQSWEFEYFWDLFVEQIAPLADHIPYMVSVGNHEKYYNFTSYKARFEMPGQDSGGIGNFYWSMDYGNIHFVSMCTEDYAYTYAPGSRQYLWLQQDLARANKNRAKTPWIFFMGHRPMYSSDLSTDSGPLQQYIEPLLHQYQVDMAFWGHMHCYERTYPVYNNVPTIRSGNVYVNPNATTHLTIGTGGALIDEKFQNPAPAWSAKRVGNLDDSYDAYGYGYLRVINSSHVHFQWLRWIDNSVWDELWLIKQH